MSDQNEIAALLDDALGPDPKYRLTWSHNGGNEQSTDVPISREEAESLRDALIKDAERCGDVKTLTTQIEEIED